MAFTGISDSKAEPYSRIVSSYDAARKPQTYGKLIQKYGDGFKLLNFLHLAGQVIDVQSETITIFEEGMAERPVTCSIAITAAPLDVIITFATGDKSDKYVREGFDLLIPPQYTDSTVVQALRLYKSGADWKGKAYNPNVAINATITTKEFSCGASSFGYGTGQPAPMSQGFTTRTTNARILKDTAGVEGGMIFQQDWEEIEMANGKKGILSKALTEMDFRLDSQKDAALFLSQMNDNTALTYTSAISGGTGKIPSFDGLLPTMQKLSQELPYTTNFDMTSFEAVKALLEAVGVTNRELDFLVGTKLNSNIESSMGAYLNVNSPGTILYDMISQYVGFGVKHVFKNGCKFNLVQLDSLSNPAKWGGSEYPFRDMGFLFPKGTHNVKMQSPGTEAQTLKLAHLTLGYAVGKTENRRHCFNVHPGVNGLGYDIVANDIDGVKWYTLTHMVPIFNFMNQTILVTKS